MATPVTNSNLVTVKDWRTNVKELRQLLQACHSERGTIEARHKTAVKYMSAVVAQARVFSEEYSHHPWAHPDVYDAGQKLFGLVKQLPGEEG